MDSLKLNQTVTQQPVTVEKKKEDITLTKEDVYGEKREFGSYEEAFRNRFENDLLREDQGILHGTKLYLGKKTLDAAFEPQTKEQISQERVTLKNYLTHENVWVNADVTSTIEMKSVFRRKFINLNMRELMNQPSSFIYDTTKYSEMYASIMQTEEDMKADQDFDLSKMDKETAMKRLESMRTNYETTLERCEEYTKKKPWFEPGKSRVKIVKDIYEHMSEEYTALRSAIALYDAGVLDVSKVKSPQDLIFAQYEQARDESFVEKAEKAAKHASHSLNRWFRDSEMKDPKEREKIIDYYNDQYNDLRLLNATFLTEKVEKKASRIAKAKRDEELRLKKEEEKKLKEQEALKRQKEAQAKAIEERNKKEREQRDREYRQAEETRKANLAFEKKYGVKLTQVAKIESEINYNKDDYDEEEQVAVRNIVGTYNTNNVEALFWAFKDARPDMDALIRLFPELTEKDIKKQLDMMISEGRIKKSFFGKRYVATSAFTRGIKVDRNTGVW